MLCMTALYAVWAQAQTAATIIGRYGLFLPYTGK